MAGVSPVPLPQLHRDWARPSHICTGTGPRQAGAGAGSHFSRMRLLRVQESSLLGGASPQFCSNAPHVMHCAVWGAAPLGVKSVTEVPRPIRVRAVPNGRPTALRGRWFAAMWGTFR